MTSTAAASPAIPVRTIVCLAAAAFTSGASLRLADPLIPQICDQFGISVSDASVVGTGFTLAYGLSQVVYGPVGDRFGKVLVILVSCVLCSVFSAAASLAPDIGWLGLCRLLGGAAAGAIVPLCMAHLGDTVPYEQRQGVLGRFLAGQMLGILAGQSLGGILGEHIGWRNTFVALGAVQLAVALLLWVDLRATRTAPTRTVLSIPAIAATYLALARTPHVQRVIIAVYVEGTLFFAGLTYFGAFLRQEYGLGYDTIGAMLAAFGLGALAYAAQAPRVVATLGQRGMMLGGGLVMLAAYLWSALTPVVWSFIPVFAALGLGYYLMHNTLQTLGTQMSPQGRGIGMSMFASALFLGQGTGVWAGGHVVERLGYPPLFVACGVGLAVLGLLFRHSLPARR